MRYVEKSAPPPGGEPEEFVMSDDTVDRMGDVIEPQGWQLDRIKTPPPVLYNHNKDEQSAVGPISAKSAINWSAALSGPISMNGRKGKYIRDLVRGGHLRTVSVGFRPLATAAADQGRQQGIWPVAFHEKRVLECSLVTVPANPNAIALAKSLKISDEIVAEVFGESARNFVASNGKPAMAHSARKSTPMSNANTIATKIQNAQQTLNALLANL